MYDLIIDFSKLKIVLLFMLIFSLVLCSVPSVCIACANANKTGVRLPILMYHHISEKQSKLNKYTISPANFKSDLEYIEKNGYKTVSVDDLISYCENGTALPEKAIMITFDDGYESIYQYAYPILKSKSMKAVINIIGAYADKYSTIDDHNVNYAHITWDELSEMQESNIFEIANHTYDLHTNGKRKGISKMRGESDEHYESIIKADLERMQSRTNQMLGSFPTAFAYPFGTVCKQALPIIKSCNIKCVFCCWEKVNYLSGDSEELYHLNRFNRSNSINTTNLFEKIEKQ